MAEFFDKLCRIAFLIALIGTVVGGVAVSYPKYANARSLNRKLAEVKRRVGEREHELALVREKQRRFNTDPEFVESLARSSRRVYPGEIVFVFDD